MSASSSATRTRRGEAVALDPSDGSGVLMEAGLLTRIAGWQAEVARLPGYPGTHALVAQPAAGTVLKPPTVWVRIPPRAPTGSPRRTQPGSNPPGNNAGSNPTEGTDRISSADPAGFEPTRQQRGFESHRGHR